LNLNLESNWRLLKGLRAFRISSLHLAFLKKSNKTHKKTYLTRSSSVFFNSVLTKTNKTCYLKYCS
jgi:hypothetical protein